MIPAFQRGGLRKHPPVSLNDLLHTSPLSTSRSGGLRLVNQALSSSALQGGVVDYVLHVVTVERAHTNGEMPAIPAQFVEARRG